MTLKEEAEQLAKDRPTSLSDDLYQWAMDAEEMLWKLSAQAAQPAQNEWKEAVIEQLAAHSMDAPVSDSPTVILAKIIHMAVLQATDPAIKVAQPAQVPEVEPVAWVLFRKDEDGLEPIQFYGGKDKPEGEFKDRFELRSVHLAPPDTEAGNMVQQPAHAHAIDTSPERVEKQAGNVQVPGWLPIESAPKDGTGVLVYCPKSLTVPVTGGYWEDHPECKCWIAGGYMQKVFPPTHWQPLPAAPSTKEGQP